MRARTVATGFLVGATLLAACAGDAAYPARKECAQPGPPQGPLAGSFEEANLLAAGEMLRVYGDVAEPVRVRAAGEVVDVAGNPAWRMDTSFEVSVDGQRRVDDWTLWVGYGGSEFLVLCADGPDDVHWPPRAATRPAATFETEHAGTLEAEPAARHSAVAPLAVYPALVAAASRKYVPGAVPLSMTRAHGVTASPPAAGERRPA